MRKNCSSPVSIVLPTYNRAHLLSRAIDSFMRAVAAGDEIIVVDDGSTDDTESVLGNYKGALRYFKTGNRGAGPARNTGIELAKHDWIAFIERFEKLNASRPIDFQRIILKRYNLKSAMDAGFEYSRGPSAGPVCSEMPLTRSPRVIRPLSIGFSSPLPR
jgi:hypothetical protein